MDITIEDLKKAKSEFSRDRYIKEGQVVKYLHMLEEYMEGYYRMGFEFMDESLFYEFLDELKAYERDYSYSENVLVGILGVLKTSISLADISQFKNNPISKIMNQAENIKRNYDNDKIRYKYYYVVGQNYVCNGVKDIKHMKLILDEIYEQVNSENGAYFYRPLSQLLSILVENNAYSFSALVELFPYVLKILHENRFKADGIEDIFRNTIDQLNRYVTSSMGPQKEDIIKKILMGVHQAEIDVSDNRYYVESQEVQEYVSFLWKESNKSIMVFAEYVGISAHILENSEKTIQEENILEIMNICTGNNEYLGDVEAAKNVALLVEGYARETYYKEIHNPDEVLDFARLLYNQHSDAWIIGTYFYVLAYKFEAEKKTEPVLFEVFEQLYNELKANKKLAYQYAKILCLQIKNNPQMRNENVSKLENAYYIDPLNVKLTEMYIMNRVKLLVSTATEEELKAVEPEIKRICGPGRSSGLAQAYGEVIAAICRKQTTKENIKQYVDMIENLASKNGRVFFEPLEILDYRYQKFPRITYGDFLHSMESQATGARVTKSIGGTAIVIFLLAFGLFVGMAIKDDKEKKELEQIQKAQSEKHEKLGQERGELMDQNEEAISYILSNSFYEDGHLSVALPDSFSSDNWYIEEISAAEPVDEDYLRMEKQVYYSGGAEGLGDTIELEIGEGPFDQLKLVVVIDDLDIDIDLQDILPDNRALIQEDGRKKLRSDELLENADDSDPSQYTRKVSYSDDSGLGVFIEDVDATEYTMDTVNPLLFEVNDGKAGFAYPTKLYTSYEMLEEGLVYTEKTHMFKGSDESELSVKISVHDLMGSELFDAVYGTVSFSESAIVEKGEDYYYAVYEEGGMVVHETMRVIEHNYYTMKVKYPTPTSEEDGKLKEYYAKCMISMCHFGPYDAHESYLFE